MFSDPEVPTPGMRQLDAPVVRGLVSRRALGDATGENRATSQPHQSTGDQAQDVKMEEETYHTSKCSELTEKLCGVCGYASLNGIASKPLTAPSQGGEQRATSCGGILSYSNRDFSSPQRYASAPAADRPAARPEKMQPPKK